MVLLRIPIMRVSMNFPIYKCLLYFNVTYGYFIKHKHKKSVS